MKKYIAEFLGTLVLVLFGTGIAVVSGGDLVATSLAFGLAIVAEAYVIGNISGCHVNPAVSLAMLISKKLSVKDFICYVVSQVLGAIAGSAILFFILSNTNLGTTALGANFYGELSATNISLVGAIVTEIVLTFVFIYTILGVTSDDSKSNVAGLVIGLTLTFVHLIGIPLTGTSVNPARSLAPAIFLGGEAIKQIWVFILFPLVGGALAALTFKYLNTTKKKSK
ncbi:MAG: MIP family channel protein [Bacilli bacterium]|nr:MIP family channel protein [Bacilli bacterium]